MTTPICERRQRPSAADWRKRLPLGDPLPAVLAAIPVPVFHALSNVSLVIPYYHIVSDEQVPHVKHLYQYRDRRQFTLDLEFLLKYYKPVALGDVLDHLAGKRRLPNRSFLLTFDDGFREMHEVVAPILKAKGLPATFFLTTGFLDNADMAHHCKLSLMVEKLCGAHRAREKEAVRRFLAEQRLPGESFEAQMVTIRYTARHLVTKLAELCEYDFDEYLSSARPYLTGDEVGSLLQQGFSIGAHSIDHPFYADAPFAEQIRQTTQSLETLSRRFGVRQRVFAFPHGAAGVKAAFFENIFVTGGLEASFGTAGMVRHPWPRHLERFPMEWTARPARQIVAKQYAMGFYKSLRQRLRTGR